MALNLDSHISTFNALEVVF